MRKLMFLLAGVLLISCGDEKKILLPKAAVSLEKNVADISPIDFFFTTVNKDTVADVSKNTVISTTNWVFNIDKRLKLKTVLPDIIALQEKKRKKTKGEVTSTKNYFSYADSIGKNLAFLNFTNVHYKLEKPNQGVVVFFDKSNRIFVNDSLVNRDALQGHIVTVTTNLKPVYYCFDKEMTYGDYILNRLFLHSIEHKAATYEEYIY